MRRESEGGTEDRRGKEFGKGLRGQNEEKRLRKNLGRR